MSSEVILGQENVGKAMALGDGRGRRGRHDRSTPVLDRRTSRWLPR